MKRITICALACLTPFLTPAVEIVTPDIELGHWVTTTDTSGFIEQALESVPEASRPMIRKMMEDKMKSSSTSQQCITQDTLKNFDEQLKNAFGKNKDCQLSVTESTKTKLVAAMQCPGSVIQITTTFISDKLSESVVLSRGTGMGETSINMRSQWKSHTCPSGI